MTAAAGGDLTAELRAVELVVAILVRQASRSTKAKIIRALDALEHGGQTPMTDHHHPTGQRQFSMAIGIEGLPRLIEWVRAGDTLEERQGRAEQVKAAVDAVLAGVDHDAFNKAARDEAERLTYGDPR
jgi:hypothetical protein